MQLFLDILLNIIFPVFLLMGMGIILHRIFTFDLRTLSKITMYYLLPVVGFVNIYESDLNGKIFLQVIVFQLGFSLVLMFLAGSFSRLTKMERSEEHTSELQSRFDLVCRLLLEKKNRSILT